MDSYKHRITDQWPADRVRVNALRAYVQADITRWIHLVDVAVSRSSGDVAITYDTDMEERAVHDKLKVFEEMFAKRE